MEVHFTTSLAQTYSAAITINGSANAILHPDFKSLKVTADTDVTASAIIIKPQSPTETPSLTIKADKLTIEVDKNSGGNPIFIANGGSLKVEGELEVINNAANAYAISLSSGPNYKGSVATFEENVILNSTNSYFSLGLHVGTYGGTSAAVATFKRDLKITTASANSVAITLARGTLEVQGDTEIILGGNNSKGLNSSTSGDTFTFRGDLNITTSGKDASGVWLELYPTATVEKNLTITTKNSGSFAFALVGNNNVQPEMSVSGKTTISTEKESSYAIYAQFAQGSFGETEIDVFGDSSYGVYAVNRVNNISTNITFNGTAKISTFGVGSHAVMIGQNSYVTFKKDASISTQKDTTNAIVASGGNAVFEDFVSIETKGIKSHGVYISSNGSVNFKNGGSIIVEGTDADAIRFYGPYSESSFKDVYAESKKGFVISNGKEIDVEVSFTGESELYGNIANQEDSTTFQYGTILLKLSDTSCWQGTSSSLGFGEVNLELKDSSSWKIAEAGSYVDSIIMSENSQIMFTHTDNTFYNATVGELSGEGIIVLNADMSLLGQGDLLHVNSISGTYRLNVIDVTQEKGGADKLTVITADNISSTLDITLASGDKVRLGAYSYILESSSNQLQWDLVRSGIDEEIIKGTELAGIGFSEFAKSIDVSLSDELLSLKRDIWIVANYKLQKFRNLPNNSMLNQNIYSLTTGIELSQNKIIDWGLFLGLNIGTQNINDIMEANLVAFTVGIKALYSHNNFSISGYIRSSSYSQTLDIIDAQNELSGVANTFGFSSSIQAINKFYIVGSNFYVAPKAKVSHTQIFDFSHNFGAFEMSYSDANSLVSWLGIKSGNTRATKSGSLEAYIEVGWAHDFNPKAKITIEEENLVLLSKNQFEMGIGLDVDTNEQAKFSFEFKYSTGKNLVEPVKLKLAASTVF